MKKCCRCKKEKAFEDFNFKNKVLGVRQKSCRDCTRQEIRNHYQNNRKYYIKKAKIRNKHFKKKVQDYKWDYLSKNPCVDCGESNPIVLDFDHQHDKIASVSDIIKNRNSLEIIKKEINKCKVRCANCHRIRTAKDFGWYKEYICPRSSAD